MIVVDPSGAVMLAFLIITSSSLAFYLGLLVVLYRDARKRPFKAAPVRKIKLGTVAELSTRGLASSATALEPPTVFIYSAETSRRRTRQSRATGGEPAEVVAVPKLAHNKNDSQCG
jgi:hypothetical protein